MVFSIMRRRGFVFLAFDQVPVDELIVHGLLTGFKQIEALAQGKNNLIQFLKEFILIRDLAFQFNNALLHSRNVTIKTRSIQKI